MLTAENILKATGGKLLSGDSRAFAGVSIDSRTISKGEIFFALRGERFDGHDFFENALLKGSGAVVDSKPVSFPKGKVVIYVEDTLKALQDLAHFLRMRQDIPVVAITGSNGKTTVKEMTYAILSRRFNVLKNEGSLNNHIGLPLSLTKLISDVEVIVLELGMNAPGEIKRLCEIAVSSHGVITNVGSAHLGRLGSYKAIRDAKLEILSGLDVAVLNDDDGFLMEGVDGVKDFDGRIITFSINNNSHVMAKDVHATGRGISFILKLRDGESVPVSLNVQGLFNVYNALAASSVCFSLGSSIDEIKEALEDYTAFPMRFEVTKENEITLINDSYNANPSSMEETLKELIRMAEGRVVAILGDMYELNEFSEDAHKALGKTVSEMGVGVFVAVGEMMNFAAEEAQKTEGKNSALAVYTFRDVSAAKEKVMDILKPGDTVLIKGSRIMGMERIIGERVNVI